MRIRGRWAAAGANDARDRRFNLLYDCIALVNGNHIGLTISSKIVKRLFFDIRQNVVDPATWLAPASSALRVTDPIPAPATRGKKFDAIVVVLVRNPNLL